MEQHQTRLGDGQAFNSKEIYLNQVSYEDLLKVGRQATIEGETIHQMPFEVSATAIANALFVVDSHVKNLVS